VVGGVPPGWLEAGRERACDGLANGDDVVVVVRVCAESLVFSRQIDDGAFGRVQLFVECLDGPDCGCCVGFPALHFFLVIAREFAIFGEAFFEFFDAWILGCLGGFAASVPVELDFFVVGESPAFYSGFGDECYVCEVAWFGCNGGATAPGHGLTGWAGAGVA
jgi:hypothetical protein